MWLAKRMVCGLLVSSWAFLAFGAETTETTISRRSDWQRRILRDTYVKPAASLGDADRSMSLPSDIAYDEMPLDPIASDGWTSEQPFSAGGGAYPRDGMMSDGGVCTDCGSCGVGRPACSDCGVVEYIDRGTWLRGFEFTLGVQGFKGPMDSGENGNFGFNEGVNFGGPVGGPWGIGYQVGIQTLQSDVSGYEESNDARDQVFFTAGLFRRSRCGGLQWATVFDLMRDHYYRTTDLNQLRAELSWLSYDGCREIGFWGAFGGKTDEIQLDEQPRAVIESTDLFAFFYRRHFSAGGEGRLWGGCTGNSDGLVGADIQLPISGTWALRSSVNYLIPHESHGADAAEQESWNVGIQLVWFPGRCAAGVGCDPYRPLMNVADNGNFMVDYHR